MSKCYSDTEELRWKNLTKCVTKHMRNLNICDHYNKQSVKIYMLQVAVNLTKCACLSSTIIKVGNQKGLMYLSP
jgi:hypothetical protein